MVKSGSRKNRTSKEKAFKIWKDGKFMISQFENTNGELKKHGGTYGSGTQRILSS